MIISASRRTDIPAFYSEWFMNRIRAGVVTTRNPFNASQVRQISLLPQDVDCFVFWTKDPLNMLDKLPILDEMGFQYYFQFTLTPYDKDIERNMRDKSEIMSTFIELSRQIGKERILWRYDPIILNDSLDIDYHTAAFERMCDSLAKHTSCVQISFVDLYKKIKTNIIKEAAESEMIELAAKLADIAKQRDLPIKVCFELFDYLQLGMEKAACIDKQLVENLIGYIIKAKRDSSQRQGCGCVQSVDIGVYNTCGNGCVYCYANHGDESIKRNMGRHNPDGENLL